MPGRRALPAVFDPSEVFLDGGRRRLPTRLWAGRDPNPTNPYRNGNAASTSNNGYYLGEFICAAETARAELGEGYCR